MRIALHLKGIPFAYVPVSSLAPGEYARLNPQGLLPALDIGGRIIAQSSAILDYLEETYPQPALLPADPVVRAEARAFAAHIASEMHSLSVQRVRRFLQSGMGADDDKVATWVNHWLALGLNALEETLRRRPIQSPFCFSADPGWADLHLVPQLSAARRLGIDLSGYTLLLETEERCNELGAFRLARPEAQIDYRRP